MAENVIVTVKGTQPTTDVSVGEVNTVDLNKTLEITLENLGEENRPDGVLFKYNEDTYKVTDPISKSPNKVLNDGAVISDPISLVNTFYRSFDDTSVTSDSTTTQWNAYRSEQDLFTASDQIKFDSNKNIQDTSLTTDILYKDFYLNLIESLIVADSQLTATSFNLSISESTGLVDSSLNSQGFGRNLPQGYFASDYVQDIYIVEGAGFERVFVTDPVEIQFNKNVTENITSSDTVTNVTTFQRNITETALFSEVYSSSIGKNIEESANYFEPGYVEYDYVKTSPGIRDFVSFS